MTNCSDLQSHYGYFCFLKDTSLRLFAQQVAGNMWLPWVFIYRKLDPKLKQIILHPCTKSDRGFVNQSATTFSRKKDWGDCRWFAATRTLLALEGYTLVPEQETGPEHSIQATRGYSLISCSMFTSALPRYSKHSPCNVSRYCTPTWGMNYPQKVERFATTIFLKKNSSSSSIWLWPSHAKPVARPKGKPKSETAAPLVVVYFAYSWWHTVLT